MNKLSNNFLCLTLNRELILSQKGKKAKLIKNQQQLNLIWFPLEYKTLKLPTFKFKCRYGRKICEGRSCLRDPGFH